MTNQEKKELAEQFKNAMQSLDANYTEPVKSIWLSLSRGVAEDLIGFLEEDSVLDKIKAEIIEMRSRQNVGVLECLDIINKYKAEGEDRE